MFLFVCYIITQSGAASKQGGKSFQPIQERNVEGQNVGTTIKLTLFGASIETLTVTKKLTIGRSPITISV